MIHDGRTATVRPASRSQVSSVSSYPTSSMRRHDPSAMSTIVPATRQLPAAVPEMAFRRIEEFAVSVTGRKFLT